MRICANAKLNITLDVLSKRGDGYHNMLMVMQGVELHDGVTITREPGEGVFVTTSLKYLPGDERNIAFRAAAAFFAHTGITGWRVDIDLEKRIPVCAGMGGGSSDGAATLRGLNGLFSAGLTEGELEELGARVGSDVPFCVRGGTALATGRGDILEALPPLPDCHIVIVKPQFAVSTPELFEKIDCARIKNRPDTAGLVRALREGNLLEIARRMYNVFEDVLPRGRGEITEIKGRMLDHRALGAVMTGTGSAVFGLFDDAGRAGAARDSLARDYEECFVTRPAGRAPLE